MADIDYQLSYGYFNGYEQYMKDPDVVVDKIGYWSETDVS